MSSLEALSVFPQLAKIMPLDEYEHACTVAGKCNNDEKTCLVALFHDVVEDRYTTFKELQERFKLDAEQMAALDAITRRQGEQYIAKTVKLADLQDNIKRCAEDLPNRWGLIRRYAKAYGILIDEWKEVIK